MGVHGPIRTPLSKIPLGMPTGWDVGLFPRGVCWVTYSAIVTSSRPPSRPLPSVLVAAGVCLLEAVLLLVTALLYGLELAGDRAVDPSTASMSLVVCLIFAILLLVLASAWVKGALWPRTPTIVWNVLLLPVAWSLATSTSIWLGLGVAVVALMGVAAAVLSPSADLTDKAL